MVYRRSLSPLAWAALAVLAATAALSHAQPAGWKPERTVEIVVPAAAGGSIDGTARLIQVERNEASLDYSGSREGAQRMARLYGQLKIALVDAGLAKE